MEPERGLREDKRRRRRGHPPADVNFVLSSYRFSLPSSLANYVMSLEAISIRSAISTSCADLVAPI